MRKSIGVECESYSCEEHPEPHDKLISYIHNLMMGSITTLLRKGIKDKTVTRSHITVRICIPRNV